MNSNNNDNNNTNNNNNNNNDVNVTTSTSSLNVAIEKDGSVTNCAKNLTLREHTDSKGNLSYRVFSSCDIASNTVIGHTVPLVVKDVKCGHTLFDIVTQDLFGVERKRKESEIVLIYHMMMINLKQLNYWQICCIQMVISNLMRLSTMFIIMFIQLNHSK